MLWPEVPYRNSAQTQRLHGPCALEFTDAGTARAQLKTRGALTVRRTQRPQILNE